MSIIVNLSVISLSDTSISVLVPIYAFSFSTLINEKLRFSKEKINRQFLLCFWVLPTQVEPVFWLFCMSPFWFCNSRGGAFSVLHNWAIRHQHQVPSCSPQNTHKSEDWCKWFQSSDQWNYLKEKNVFAIS